MANLKALDGDGTTVYLGATGAGTDLDPLKVQHSDTALQELVDLLLERFPVALSNGKLAVDVNSSDALLTVVRDRLIEIVGGTDTLETLLGTLNSYASAVEALLVTANSTNNIISIFIDQIRSYTDSIETNQVTQQGTLAAILTKLIAAPATEAKQDELLILDTAIRDRLPVAVSACTPSVVVIGTTSGVVLVANSARLSAVIINNSGVDVFLSRSNTAALNQGILLKARGGAYEINSTNLYRGVISAIAATATSLYVEEGI